MPAFVLSPRPHRVRSAQPGPLQPQGPQHATAPPFAFPHPEGSVWAEQAPRTEGQIGCRVGRGGGAPSPSPGAITKRSSVRRSRGPLAHVHIPEPPGASFPEFMGALRHLRISFSSKSGKVSSTGSLLRKPTQSLAPRKAVGRPGRLVSRETPWERKNTGSSFMGGGLGKISVQVKGEQHAGCVLRCLHHREGPEISRTRPETVVP